MYERFLATYGKPDVTPNGGPSPEGGIAGLRGSFAGATFMGGLYRVHDAASAALADSLVAAAFPEFAGRAACFGFDWLGRQFATDSSRGVSGNREVLMFEPGTGEALEIPVPFSEFHDVELVDFGNAALAVEFFQLWFEAAGSRGLAFTECAGYKIPLFLSGEDAVSNLEVVDIDVYWTITGQLRLNAKDLPPGTPFGPTSAS